MIDNAPGGSKLAIFFEAGHASSGKSKEILDKVMVGEQGSKYEIFTGYTFAKKGELCLLEAADMLVWQTTKYIKDAAFTSRPPRKDFYRLAKHRLTVIYPFCAKNRATVVIITLSTHRRG